MADEWVENTDAPSASIASIHDEPHQDNDVAHRKRKEERKAASRKRKHEKKHHAAIKIQAHVRGHQARAKHDERSAGPGPRLDQLPSPTAAAIVAPELLLISPQKSSDQLLPNSARLSSRQESTAPAGPSVEAVPTVVPVASRGRLEPVNQKLAPLTKLASAKGPPESLAHAKNDAKSTPLTPAYEEQVRRATQIQATFRGHEGRSEAMKLREEVEASLREEAAAELAREEVAATEIQAVYRGYRIRECLAESQPRTPSKHARHQAKGTAFPSSDAKDATTRNSRSSVSGAKDCKSPEVDDDDKKPRPWPTSMTLQSQLGNVARPLARINTADDTADVTNHTTHDVISRRQVRVFVMTWNLQAQKPPADLRQLLRPGSCHIYAIGTEECVQTIAKSVLFQSKKEWEDHVKDTLGPTYVKLRSHALTAMHNVVFVHTSILPLVSELHSDAIATGLGNQLGNKGGVGIGFVLGRTSFAFVGCHFEAHQSQQALARRNANFHKINSDLQLVASTDEHRKGPVSSTFDRVFWCGDLNYRIDGTRKMIDDLLARNFHDVLLVNDQLRKEMAAGRVFQRFREGPLNFMPTYKFDKGCDVYDTSAKQRIPSWTDRILYFSTIPTAMTLQAYESHMDVKTSDHRPVTAVFDVDFVSDINGQDRAAPASQTKSEVCAVQ